MSPITRRRLLTTGLAAPALVLGGCDWLGASPSFREIVLGSGEWLSYRVHRLIGSSALAREFDPSRDVARVPHQRQHRGALAGVAAARGGGLRRLAAAGRRAGRGAGGLLARRAQAMPARSQITRHDCVEGWSAIGKWTGVPLSEVLGRVRLRPEARFIVLHCADDFATGLQRLPYYESIDLVDAFHPQTILAYGMNDATLPIGHGAPIRLRVERQLGYKHAKFVMRVEAVASLAAIGQGRGGFWEDQGYDWYAGI